MFALHDETLNGDAIVSMCVCVHLLWAYDLSYVIQSFSSGGGEKAFVLPKIY